MNTRIEPSPASSIETPAELSKPASQRRVQAVDAVKGISILLVVLLHANTYWHLNEFFRLIRMPLFFFAAGLFAAGSMKLPWGDFVLRKAGNTFYIYFVWVFVGWALRFIPYSAAVDPFAQFPTLIEIFSPTGVLWFMYAVGFCYLIAKAIDRVPAILALSLATIASIAVTYWAGDDAEFFGAKVVRLLPFFLLSLYYHAEIKTGVVRIARFWPLPVLCYTILHVVRPETTTLLYALLAPLMSTIGIASVVMFCFRYEGWVLVKVAALAGAFSLSIYLLHGPIIFHLQRLLPADGVVPSEAMALILVIPIALLSILLSRLIIKPFAGWLVLAPWLAPQRTQSTART